ncbi:MAG: serine hydrolase [Flavobacteriales bacterium]|nr:serine hydrolase [Flavobacteriales bacterium]
MRSKFFAVLIVMMTAVSHLQAQQAQLQEVFENNELMGMSVAIVCHDGIETFHFGLKDYDRELTVDDSTMYRIASISKLVTAMALMRLYEEGAFGLDDDVSDALGFEFRNPNWPDIPVTYRMLLSHTSGFQDGTGYGDFLADTYGTETPPSVAELALPGADYYTSNMWRQEETGTYFTYANANYGIIGTLIESLSGQRFDIYMREHILEPLGIAGSFNVNDIENIDNVAVLYRNTGGWTPQADNYQGDQPILPTLDNYVPGTNGFVFAPQGGLRASAFDLARIILVFSGNDAGLDSPLSDATVALMQQPQWVYDGNNGDNYYGLFRSWGLGVHRTTDTSGGDHVWEDDLFRGHPGEAYGLISDLYWREDNVAGFVFLTNGAWNGYEFGDLSAYYSVEEEVFAAINAGNVWGCELGIAEHKNDISIYPNPTSIGRVMISGPKPDKVELLSSQGSLQGQLTFASGDWILGGVAPGYYVLRINYGTHSAYLPFVVSTQ